MWELSSCATESIDKIVECNGFCLLFDCAVRVRGRGGHGTNVAAPQVLLGEGELGSGRLNGTSVRCTNAAHEDCDPTERETSKQVKHFSVCVVRFVYAPQFNLYSSTWR